MVDIRVELISIGNELLAGHTVNTNASWLANALAGIGARVHWITTISDTPDEIISALKLASQRADMIISTGGLGPTPDDLTKQTIAGYFNSKLVINVEILKQVQEIFIRRNIPMPDVNRGQAMLPDKAEIIRNPVGTAPALIFHKKKQLYAFLPGVPREMRALTDPYLLDYIKRTAEIPQIKSVVFRTTGIAESKLYEEIKPAIEKYTGVDIAYLPKYSGVDLRLKTIYEHEMLDKLQHEIRYMLSDYIFTESEDNLEKVIGDLLRQNHLTLAVAESFTGGLISDKITDIPGSSDYFMGAVITYSNRSKTEQLGVLKKTLTGHGAVSEQTVREMVKGVQDVFKTDCALATTGIAGPGGGSKEKPVGLCFLAAACKDTVTVRKYTFGTDRNINKQRGCAAALDLLRRLVISI